ncbi:anti-sigma factor [Paenibacillus sp. MWE-103]|uniref:Anti-sigma factor n=1 Tax=Paenibacillus artemisiicola TaxID=1172618 RepID=A0ABS3WIZ4_9BACL|nr:anti-sigma factor [Paenibacillus artemisiicola]MBO7748237.1 anti-sigma factor [Paenibacillus artemisiicola]
MRSTFEDHLTRCGECRQFAADIASVTDDCPEPGAAACAPTAGLKAWVRAHLLRDDLTEEELARSPRIIGGMIAVCLLLITAAALLAFHTNELSSTGSSPAVPYYLERIVDLQASETGFAAGAEGHAVVIFDGFGAHLVVQADKLPEPEKDEAYRVWLQKDGVSVSAGTIPTEAGEGAMRCDGITGRFERIAISLEPDAAVANGPHGPLVLTGDFS